MKVLRFLLSKGAVSSSFNGKLFLASAYTLAKKYTLAIIEFNALLKSSHDPSSERIIGVSLAKVYFAQSLYNESMALLQPLVLADASDAEAKIWLAKNYAALGEKARAKDLLSQVLSADADNAEAKSLIHSL